ncbi:opine dehydrogenase [Devosia enhydra]|uniref:Opine dehydrogenase n=1 Tax=Devosia enhydra TaxID=665118 RepID=A0A1K2I024_9HYPH|nr:NAD/NADP octopine/nopaline dehydrogenase family protein [Devosia enhydra]SFZ85539.1 opine dehydrogenase [Devosia enhydra]
MKVAILGAGAIGLASAAHLVTRGHAPVLWSPSGKSTEPLRAGELVVEGLFAGAYRVAVADRLADAVAGADAVLVALPANGHRMVYDRLAESLVPGQLVIINAHPALGGFALAQRLAAAGRRTPIIAWGTTLLRARRTGPAAVRINTLRKRIDAASLPAGDDAALGLCAEIFGDHFTARADLLAISLSNLNPQAHLALALTNFTRMERGEAWGQSENLTASVARLMAGLDAERLAMAARLGLSVRTAPEHYHLSYGIPIDRLETMAEAIRAEGPGQLGPTGIETRYVLEDAPFGLVPLVRLGEALGLDPVLHRSGLALLSALYGRDFAAENDLVGDLDIAALLAGR